MAASRKNAPTTRGRPFARGNAGRPKGARNRTTLAVEALLDGEADRLTRKAIKLALAGDSTALRLCMDRIAPLRRGRAVRFPLPPIKTTANVVDALAAVSKAMAAGQLSPAEAVEVAAVIELQRKAIETAELETRLARLEERTQGRTE
jgi:hypothetical protein